MPSMWATPTPVQRGFFQAMTALAFGLFILFLSACGGGGSTSQNQQPNTSSLQVNIGDAPSDRLVAFGMTISSMAFTNSSGSSVPVLSSPATVEMTHLMGAMLPLSVMKIPQGTYTQASITMQNMAVAYMDPATGQLVQKTVAGPSTATVSFSPSLTVGSNPMVANFDMNMASSVSIDGMGNITFTPTFAAVMNPGGTGSHDPENGGMQHMTGTVASFSGSSFSMSMMESSSPITIGTNSNTVFDGMGGMGMMSNNLIVMVDADMQPDGSMMATTVQDIMSSGGVMSEGLVTSVTGNPVTQLTLVAHDGAGNGMMPSNIGGTITVNVDSGTSCAIDSDGVDMSSLPFTPAFDRTTILKGQRVEPDSSSGMMSGGGMGGGMMGGGTITATDLRLEQQGLGGTVSAYSSSGSQATFTLTLASDSALTTLTGATTLTVFQQAGTELRGMTTVTNGSTVHVRGLLFFDAGAYKLVASRIMAP